MILKGVLFPHQLTDIQVLQYLKHLGVVFYCTVTLLLPIEM